ncbi:MAG: LacI family DNA-binding transcriptional regulator, partial [Clostridia bacterium]|nr:LacI family DNA-binding transcriptional regulator [Clostridia bacterium]
MSDNVTIVDIAKEAGVSIATVSRVLSGAGSVRQSTREKVEAVVERYGYTPNMIAASLNKRKSRALGIVLPFLDNPYYSRLCIAAQNTAQANGYSALLYQMKKGSPIPSEFIDMLIGKRLDGVLFSGDVMDATSKLEATNQVLQLRRHMPVVIINPIMMDVECAKLMNDFR